MKRPQILSARFVETVRHPGRFGDGRGGHGLSLLVKPMTNGRLSKSWSQRFRIDGIPRNIGLGKYPIVTLAASRKKALANVRAIDEGKNPFERVKSVPNFETALDIVIGIHASGWKDSSKSEKQWRASLRDYAMPRLGNMAVDRITTSDVMAVLLSIWNNKRETAQRVRQRIGAVMKWAIAEGHRDDNPAGEAIGAALPKNSVIRTHQRALPFNEVAAAIKKVRNSGAYRATVLAFEFLVLTAARSGEVRCATWDEVDFDKRTWIVPASRMKTKLEHRVPLSERALEVLAEARELSTGTGLIFPSVQDKVLSDNTVSKLLRELEIGAVPHGFRSSFRQWAAERTNVPREVCELALAHVNSDRVEAAYQRSDLFEQRRKLMDAWAQYLSMESARVLTLRGEIL